MNDIHTASQKFNLILYADATTLISPLCSFIHSSQSDMDYVSFMINMEDLKFLTGLPQMNFHWTLQKLQKHALS